MEKSGILHEKFLQNLSRTLKVWKTSKKSSTSLGADPGVHIIEKVFLWDPSAFQFQMEEI